MLKIFKKNSLFIITVLLLSLILGGCAESKGYIPLSSSDNVVSENAVSGNQGNIVNEVTDTSYVSVSTDSLIGTDVSEQPEVNSGSKLEVHFLDVGQGDCILIGCDNEWMLIDAGDNDKGTAVQLYLQKQGIDHLKYFIVTHRHADHCGGADVIITKYDIDYFMTPNMYATTRTFEDVVSALDYKGLKNTLPEPGMGYTLGDASFTILGPLYIYDNENNNSLIIRLDYEDTSYLFMGDAEYEAELALVNSGRNINADVLKIGHHGSYSSTSNELLDAVNPEYAVISCGFNNQYGHPNADCLNKLRSRGIDLYRTDEQGVIVLQSDGHSIEWNCSPDDTWRVGEQVAAAGSTTQDTTTYSNVDSTYNNTSFDNTNSNAVNDSQNVVDSNNDNITQPTPVETVNNNTTDTDANSGMLVWLSATGSKYHSINNCGNMNPNNARQVTLEEALGLRMEQCSKCW